MDEPARSYHLSSDDFRRRGHELVDWVADYVESLEQRPVRAAVEPGWVREQLPAAPPEQPEAWADIVADLDRIVLPGVTHWQHPGWFAYFPANASGPSVLADLVSSGLGVQGMLWSTSPACTELETHVLDWFVDLLGLPARFRSDSTGGGVIQDSASSANLCALLAARWRVAGDGPFDRLRLYASRQAHSSVEKAVRVAGLAPDQLRPIDTDDAFALRPEALAEAMQADAGAGLVPFLVVATTGTTSSTALDPTDRIADVCAGHGAWLHVDAAHAGAALVCPELRGMSGGPGALERVDSWCFDPHKWLFTNFDCDCLWVADRSALIGALSVLPEYLRYAASESGSVIDYRDWHIPLGRRFRSLKLWFVLRHYGAEGLRHHVRRHIELAQQLARWLEGDPRFELVAPVPLNLVCFRHVAGDEASEGLLHALNASGEVALTHTRLAGRYVLRASVGSWTTEQRHVDRLRQLIDDLAPR